MKNMFFANLLVTLLTIQFVRCSVFVPEPCANVPNTKNLSYKKIVGDWFLLVRRLGDFEETDTCVSYKVSLVDERHVQIKVTWLDANGKEGSNLFTDKIKEGNPGAVEIQKDTTIKGLWKTENTTVTITGSIVDTDYTNYLVIYQCYQKPHFWVSEKKDNLLILVKSRSFDSIKMLIPIFNRLPELKYDANGIRFFYNDPSCKK